MFGVRFVSRSNLELKVTVSASVSQCKPRVYPMGSSSRLRLMDGFANLSCGKTLRILLLLLVNFVRWNPPSF